jgi:hypothetical protein
MQFLGHCSLIDDLDLISDFRFSSDLAVFIAGQSAMEGMVARII